MARRAEDRVDDRAGRRGVQPVLHRDARDAGVPQVLRHDHRRHGDPGEYIAAERAALVARQPVRDGGEATHGAGARDRRTARSSQPAARRGKCSHHSCPGADALAPRRQVQGDSDGMRDPSRSPARARWRPRCPSGVRHSPLRRSVLTLVALATAGLVVVHRRVLGIKRRPSWPPPPDAVTPDGAQAATEAFAARAGARPRDAALDFAWSTAATLEPWADGEHFFPRILADVEAARSSVHILMFGWREGEVGHADGRAARAEAGRGRRGAGHRRRARLQALHAGARDVHAARRGGRADRRQRRPPARPRRPLPRRPRSTGARTSSDGPTIASSTSSTAPSPGRAAPASRTTSTTAASTT